MRRVVLLVILVWSCWVSAVFAESWQSVALSDLSWAKGSSAFIDVDSIDLKENVLVFADKFIPADSTYAQYRKWSFLLGSPIKLRLLEEYKVNANTQDIFDRKPPASEWTVFNTDTQDRQIMLKELNTVVALKSLGSIKANPSAASATPSERSALTQFLGIPFGVGRLEAEQTLMGRAGTNPFPPYTNANSTGFISYFYNMPAYIDLNYFSGRFKSATVYLPVPAGKAMELFEQLKAQLIEKYGQPDMVQGEKLNSKIEWDFPAGAKETDSFLKLVIVETRFFVVDKRVPEQLRQPYSVGLAYVKVKLAGTNATKSSSDL